MLMKRNRPRHAWRSHRGADERIKLLQLIALVVIACGAGSAVLVISLHSGAPAWGAWTVAVVNAYFVGSTMLGHLERWWHRRR